jgi:hypothetical protein
MGCNKIEEQLSISREGTTLKVVRKKEYLLSPMDSVRRYLADFCDEVLRRRERHHGGARWLGRRG